MSERKTPEVIRETSRAWLFSPREDLLAFLLPTAVAVALTVYLSSRGLLRAQLGPFGWLFAVVLVDVAHVYATLYRVYVNRTELLRRKVLYFGVPIFTYVVGVLAYFHGALDFWRLLAALAVFHFVRQQYGWVALSGRKEGVGRFDRIVDAAAVYAGTIYPLIYWHAHLPRRFSWFTDGDFFVRLPVAVAAVARIIWLAIGVLWVLRQVQRAFFKQELNIARLLVMTTTWLSWYLGIVYYNSDVAFTVTNVLPHGIPYFVLLYRYRRNEIAANSDGNTPRAWQFSGVLSALLFYLPLALLAFAEEGVWDRFVWHDHGILFPGPEFYVTDVGLCFLVPLLAVPQAAHYLLDAWIWKVGPQNPNLKRNLRL